MRRALALLTATATISTAIIVAGPAQAAPRTIDWQPCPDAPGVECGTLTVPIDWSRPGGATIDLALARRKATVPAERIGSIVINPGGPGGEGAGLIKFTQFLSDDVARRFDIVGFDPRGVGQSHPILCDLAIALEPFPVEPQNQAEFAQMVDHNRRYGESCRALSGPLFDFVDSVSVARDIDAIRAALGDEKLTYYGVSYGTLLGQMYAELFPHRVRALVLDSNMDHSLSTAFQFMRTETVGFEESYGQFAEWNERTPDSPLAGQDARAVYRELLARAERGELTFPDGTPLTALDFRFQSFGSLYGPDWRSLAEAYAFLQAQSSGTAKAGPLAQQVLAKRAAPKFASAEAVPDPFQAVFCQDWRLPLHNYAELATYRAVLRHTVAPTVETSPLGELGTTACQGWPDRATNPQHRLRVESRQPILLVNSRYDPATPYQWATNAAGQSRSFVLLHYDGWGHGAYFAGSSCVTGAVDNYLFTRQAPARGTHCPAVPPPDSLGAQRSTIKAPTTPRW